MPKKDALLTDDNAQVLADLVADPNTTDALRVKIITEFLQAKEGQDFFKTMFEDALSWGECPTCKHTNHWAVPENDLNQMGFITSEHDPNVPIETNKEICPTWHEACLKKKIIA